MSTAGSSSAFSRRQPFRDTFLQHDEDCEAAAGSVNEMRARPPGRSNGAEDQYNIIDVVPGQRGYTPLWGVNLVTWKNGVTSRRLTSAVAVRKAIRAGEVTVKKAGIVVNCPVI